MTKTWTHWAIDTDPSGFAWLTFDLADKSANILTQAALDEFDAVLNFLETDLAPPGLALLSGKPGGFVYGADIRDFEVLTSKQAVQELLTKVHSLFDRLAGLPCPTVAGVDGLALGGGLELALACDGLIVTGSPKTALGFPEINLGIMPGYGGTGRAYARAGLAHTLDLCLTGKPVSAGEAVKRGLADLLVEHESQLKEALRLWLDQARGKKVARAFSSESVASAPDVEVLKATRERYLSRLSSDHTPAPFAIIDHFARHVPDARALIDGEREVFPDLMLSPASDGLRRTFYLTDLVKKSGRGQSSIQKVHVLGAGVMGGDIAAVAALTGLSVTLTDLSSEAIDKAEERAHALFVKRCPSPEALAQAKSRFVSDPEGKGAEEADLIIEAVAESLPVKQKVFATLEASAPPDAILATNTSAIPLEEIARSMKAPERLIGLHFFNPVPALPLVEVVWSQFSDTALVTQAMAFVGRLGKMPIRCQSSPGFLVNRALLPYMYKAVASMIAGLEGDTIDEALIDFGMPMGPIELCDQVGLDVCYDIGLVLGMPDEVRALFDSKIQEGKKGRKSGEGFYVWKGNKAERPRRKGERADNQAIVASLLEPMIAACQWAVGQKVVDGEDFADAGMIFGTGFPRFRGGPLHWAKRETLSPS